jgi:para-nitrobenzyl esterase
MIDSRRLLPALVAALLAACTPAAAFGAGAAADRGDRGGGLVVSTDRGVVRGALAGPVRQFLGIPYAAPPVGALRWRAPQAHAAWSAVRDATAFGSPCPQTAGRGNPGSADEDCLSLNVYAPARADRGKKLPVMFWIHGGSLVTGAGSLYGPAELVARDVVVVTINYRLGALGFLAHPALSAETPAGASGNYGMVDQVAALRWTQRNIRRFGGDPGNVTIFGESSGGTSVHTQLVSPLARGLFAKAIAQSGAAPPAQATQAEANAAGAAFADAAGCPDQTASCLRGLPVATLLAHQAGLYFPNIDGTVLTQSIGSALATGAFNRVPLIEGTNHDEWRFFVATAELASGRPIAADGYEAAIQSFLIGAPQSFVDLLANVVYPLSAYGGDPSVALGALGTDPAFACPARTAVRAVSQFAPAFQYEFADEDAPAVLPPVGFPQGAAHATELQYLFPNVARGPLSPAQQQLSAAMIGYWTRFARTGDPNSDGAPAWPLYSAASDRFLSLVPPVPAAAGGFAVEHNCAIWGQ